MQPDRQVANNSDSITLWIGKLKAGNDAAAQPLWEHYFSKLVYLAEKRLTARDWHWRW